MVGVSLGSLTLYLTKGRDFKWTFVNLGDGDVPVPFPAGDLFFEFDTSPKTVWSFDIVGEEASVKVESSDVDLIPARTSWQLVFLPAGEVSGGDPIARGKVEVQK